MGAMFLLPAVDQREDGFADDSCELFDNEGNSLRGGMYESVYHRRMDQKNGKMRDGGCWWGIWGTAVAM